MLWTSDVVKDPWFPLVKDPSEVCPSVLLPPKSIYATRLLFYCAFGERSAMAVQAAQAAGLTSARHIHGGMQAWQRAEGPVAR